MSEKEKIRVSLVIPAYNEEQRLGPTLQELTVFLRDWLGAEPWEIIVVDDGSVDGTSRVAETFSGAGVTLVRSAENRGKGEAVRRGILASSGDWVFMVDADLPYALDFFCHAFEILRDRGVDAVVGARDLPESSRDPTYPAYRVLAGQVFSHLVNFTLRLGIFDTQCGLKGFQGDLIRRLMAYTQERGFALDIEMLAALKEVGAVVERRPVRLVRHHGSKVRLLRDSLKMAAALVRIFIRKGRGEYRGAGDNDRRTVCCPLCGGGSWRPLRLQLHGVRFVSCLSCGSYFQNPRPSDSALRAAYNPDYYQTGSTDSGYDDYYAYQHELGSTAKEVWQWVGSVAGPIAGRILDVGCGSGEFLRAVGKGELTARIGLDLVKPRDGSGFDFVRAYFPQTPFSEEVFDFVIFNDSFEHLCDPKEGLREAARLLRPGGWLLINVPDRENWTARLSGRNWISFKREHLFLPSRQALTRLLDSSGFEVAARRPSRMLVGADYLAPRLRRIARPAAWLARLVMGRRHFLLPTTGSLWLARRRPSD